jgi:hypothetical protein
MKAAFLRGRHAVQGKDRQGVSDRVPVRRIRSRESIVAPKLSEVSVFVRAI